MNTFTISLYAVPISWGAMLAMGYQVNLMIGVAFILGAVFQKLAD